MDEHERRGDSLDAALENLRRGAGHGGGGRRREVQREQAAGTHSRRHTLYAQGLDALRLLHGLARRARGQRRAARDEGRTRRGEGRRRCAARLQRKVKLDSRREGLEGSTPRGEARLTRLRVKSQRARPQRMTRAFVTTRVLLASLMSVDELHINICTVSSSTAKRCCDSSQ